jgi:PAS domain S-box-containing protein
MDDQLTVVAFNEVAQGMAGYAFGTKLELGADFLSSLPESKQEQFMSHLNKVQAGEKVVYEICFPDENGLEKWLYVRIYGIKDEQNNTYGLCIAASDISRRKKAEKEIIDLNQSLEEKIKLRTAELEQANHELESFSYTVSHDLQAPLRILRGFSDVLLEEYGDKLDESGRESLDIISKNAALMSQLIKELLDFAHIGKTSLAKRTVSMDDICQAVLDEVKKLDPTLNAEIHLNMLGSSYCDPALIRQVWSNLIQNAIKYSRKKPQAVIEIGTTVVNDKQAYYVKDNGAGFDMKYARKLFGVFKRLHSSDEFEGTGVGLAVVHRIITRHGGEIWADAKVGEGAAFYFTLPGLLGEGT